MSQFHYPLPVAACDHQPSPYTTDTGRTIELIIAGDTFGNDSTDTARIQCGINTDGLIVTPNQTILLNPTQDDTSTENARAIPGGGITIAEKIPFETSLVSQLDALSHVYSRPHLKVQTPILPITDPIRDGSTPYVPRHDPSRGTKLQHLANALTAVVEQENLECDDCGKDCKDKAALRSASLPI